MIITNKNKIILNKGVVVNKFSLDDMTIAFVSGLTTKPSTAHIKLIDTFVKQTKTILQTKADVVYLGNINNSNDSFRNLVKNSHHGTIQGTGLVWDSYWGFRNPLGTGYVNTNYNPSTQGVKYTLNDAAILVYLGKNNNNKQQAILGGYSDTTKWVSLAINGNLTELVCRLNDNTSSVISNIPFLAGLHGMIRKISTTLIHTNQNKINDSIASTSSDLPNINITIFKRNGTALANYTDAINFVYIGASLTDAEFTTLNNAVNDYLIQCLFLKYGEDNWGVKMTKSYFLELHNFEKYEAWEVYEFIKRCQSDYIGFTPVNIVPAASSSFETDGTAWWGVIRGIKQYNASTQDMTVIGDGTVPSASLTIVRNAYLTLGKTYKISFSAKSSNYVGQMLISETGLNPISLGALSSTYKQFVGYITPSTNGNIRIEIAGAVLDREFTIDNIIIEEWIESDTTTFNKCLNSGFGNATDWIDSNGDGLADGWGVSSLSYMQPSIVVGNGFKGRVQRIDYLQNASNFHLYYNFFNPAGKSVTLYFKYRSNKTLTVSNYGNDVLYAPINTSDCKEVIINNITSGGVNIRFTIVNANAGDWFEIDEVCIIDNCNSQFYYNFFGPNGLNKQVCDWMMLFKAGGNLIANIWVKTGALLRWNQDGSVTNSNTMPAYTRGSNLGIVTVTSTDGWDMLSNINNVQTYNSVNSFYGNFPRIGKIKTNNKLEIVSYYNRIKFDLRSNNISNWCNSIYIVNILFPGGIKFNLQEIIGNYYSNLYLSSRNVLYDSIIGDVTELTDEVYIQFRLEGNGVYGNFSNMKLPDSLTQFFVLNSNNITSGLPIYNRNISQLYFTGCGFSTQAILDQLTVQKNQFAITPPIKNLTDNFSGSAMGIVPANHQLILDIIAQHTAAGFTATITVRTS